MTIFIWFLNIVHHCRLGSAEKFPATSLKQMFRLSVWVFILVIFYSRCKCLHQADRNRLQETPLALWRSRLCDNDRSLQWLSNFKRVAFACSNIEFSKCLKCGLSSRFCNDFRRFIRTSYFKSGLPTRERFEHTV